MDRSSKRFKDSNRLNIKPLVILGLILLLLVLGYLTIRPLRYSLAGRYLESGERKLAEQKYVEATVELRKSDWLEAGKADEAFAVAERMQQDILVGEHYFRKYQNLAMLEGIAHAKKIPESESAGLLKVKQLVEADKPQLAEVAAEILLEMDDGSARVWTFLVIARLEAARKIEMTKGNQRLKLESAKEAFSKAVLLNPEDKISAEYLKEVEMMLSGSQ